MTIKQKANIYHELVEVVTNLRDKQNYLQEKAKDELEYSKNQETGEVNEKNWHYDRYKEILEQVEDINALITILEKI